MSVPTTPLDSPEFMHRIGALRTLVLAFAIILTGVTFGIWMVVRFALDGVPLAGNLYKLAGIPVPTLIASIVVLATPFLAILAGKARGRSGLRQVAAAHPELAGSADEAERLFDAFASVVFAEAAITFGAGFACAIVFHVTTDPVILVGVGLLISFLLIRRPSMVRARNWVVQSARDVQRNRS